MGDHSSAPILLQRTTYWTTMTPVTLASILNLVLKGGSNPSLRKGARCRSNYSSLLDAATEHARWSQELIGI